MLLTAGRAGEGAAIDAKKRSNKNLKTLKNVTKI